MTRGKAGAGVAVAVVAAALAVTGVGAATAGQGAHTAKGTTLRLSADPHGNLTFNATKLSAKAGKVTLLMKNPGSSGLDHGIAVKGKGLDKDGPIVAPGKTSTVTVTLKAGKTYRFYCPVMGHAAAGMKGKLTVK
jgi:uncharacterized cupredoxin-like copper-binding protein